MNSVLETIRFGGTTRGGQRPHRLEKGAVVRVKRVRARSRIRCRTGQLWITQTGLACDIVPTSGQSFESDREEHLLIEALEPACFTYEEPSTPKNHE